jgi:hypothetical protein
VLSSKSKMKLLAVREARRIMSIGLIVQQGFECRTAKRRHLIHIGYVNGG